MELTSDQIKDLLGALSMDYAERNRRIDVIRTVRRMENKLVDSNGMSLVPERYRKIPFDVHLPLVRDTHQRISASLTANYIKWIIPPWSNKPDAVRASGKREQVINAAFPRMEQEAGRPIFRRIVASTISTGWGVSQLTYKPDHWANWPRRKKVEDPEEYFDRIDEFKMGRRLPFMWRHIPTETFYPILAEGRISRALVCREVPIYDVASEFNMDVETIEAVKRGSMGTAVLPEGTKRNFSTIKVIEYWDDKNVSYVLGDGKSSQIVDEWEHGYGRVPFFISMADQGEEDDPTFLSESPLWPVAMLQPLIEALVSIKMNIAYIYGYPTPVIETPPEAQVGVRIDEDTGEPAPIDWELGDIVTLGRGQKVTFPLQQASTGPDIDDLISFLLSMTDRASLPALARGEGVGSDWSGYLMAQLNAAIKGRLQESVNSIEASFAEMGEFFQYLIECKLKSPMIVDSGPTGGVISIAPKDIRKYYKTQCRLNADIPQNMALIADTALKLMKGKLWTRRRSMESVGVDDVTAEAEEILLDELLEYPEVKQLSIQLAGKEIVEALQAEAGQQPPPAPGAGVVPPGGGPMPPGTPGAGLGAPISPEEMAAAAAGGGGGIGGRPEGGAKLPGGVPGGASESMVMPGPGEVGV